MKPIVPGTQASRAAALALLALVAVLAGWLVTAPMLAAARSLDEEIADTRATRARYYRRTTMPARERDAADVLRAETAPLAAAALQGRLAAIVEEAGGTVERLEATVLAGRQGGRLEGVRTSGGIAVTTAQLRQILLEVERGPPVMIVDELAVRVAPREGETASAVEERLQVELGVRAFRQRGRAR